MSDKINVEAILGKHKVEIGIFDEGKLNAAIKEIVGLVIDKIAEDAEIKRDAGQDLNGISIDKESILNIKKEIEYE